MMRSPKSFVVAVRRPDGSIAVREEQWETLLPGFKMLRWPFLRGALVLLESIHNGFSALRFSSEYALTPNKPARPAGSPSEEAKPQAALTEVGSGLLLTVATVLMVGLFIAAP